MTGFLASAASVEEARLALAGGADIIDLKNPHTGALGALPRTTIAAAVEAVGPHAPTSATIGDLAASPAVIAEAVRGMKNTGVDFIKIGLFTTSDAACRLIDSLGVETLSHRLVAVLFADCNPDLSLLPRLAAGGFHGVMLDTAKKNGLGLCNCLSVRELARFVETATELQLVSGLAGQLTIADIPGLLPLKPDYLGFRSALCLQQERGHAIDRQAVEKVRRLIPKDVHAQTSMANPA
jgi:dihydroneopterin aldolase